MARSAAGRVNRRGVAWDARTGDKVRGRKLRIDPETKTWTVDPDLPNPQRFVRPPGPDGVHNRLRGGGNPVDRVGVTVDVTAPRNWFQVYGPVVPQMAFNILPLPVTAVQTVAAPGAPVMILIGGTHSLAYVDPAIPSVPLHLSVADSLIGFEGSDWGGDVWGGSAWGGLEDFDVVPGIP